ncbi:hypothetical protein JW979_15985 [bacterium]|nr:hypothetical protein [candidate division CSSED10-310 bacterium]
MMHEMKNIFAELEEYNCFACGPEHPYGLKLKFSYDDENAIVVTRITPDSLLAGFPGILHGGIQATILDELAFWGTIAKFKKSGFTFDLSVRYRKKCPVDKEIEGIGFVGELTHHLASTSVQLRDPITHEIYTEGTVRYYLPDKEPRSSADS